MMLIKSKKNSSHLYFGTINFNETWYNVKHNILGEEFHIQYLKSYIHIFQLTNAANWLPGLAKLGKISISPCSLAIHPLRLFRQINSPLVNSKLFFRKAATQFTSRLSRKSLGKILETKLSSLPRRWSSSSEQQRDYFPRWI